jgi:Fe-S oxidoreductase
MNEPVTIHFQGETITAHLGETLIQALWDSGHRLTDHVGCLGGACGACSGTYTDPATGEPRSALACQLMVRDGLDFRFTVPAELPAPAYRSDALRPDLAGLLACHPETVRCRICQACTLVCPQHIDAMAAVVEALQGRLAVTAELGLSCVGCGLCMVVCDVGIAPQLVMAFARRSVGAAETAADPTLTARPALPETRWAELLEATPEALLAQGEE